MSFLLKTTILCVTFRRQHFPHVEMRKEKHFVLCLQCSYPSYVTYLSIALSIFMIKDI